MSKDEMISRLDQWIKLLEAPGSGRLERALLEMRQEWIRLLLEESLVEDQRAQADRK